jgi:hypothetical protein
VRAKADTKKKKEKKKKKMMKNRETRATTRRRGGGVYSHAVELRSSRSALPTPPR